jgi:hypothetical protein
MGSKFVSGCMDRFWIRNYSHDIYARGEAGGKIIRFDSTKYVVILH